MAGDIIRGDSSEDDVLISRESSVIDPRTVVGQWCWVGDGESEWLGCVIHVGSNFIELNSPHGKSGYRTIRIHMDERDEHLRHEPNASSVIQGKIAYYQKLSSDGIEKIKEITSRLGVGGHSYLTRQKDSECMALSVISGRDKIKDYEKALIKAKEKDIPGLLEEVRKSNENLAAWMTAESLPLEATSRQLRSTLDDVSDRIFNVSLYAGLSEDVALCRDGTPAAETEKLRVMQRRLYMDEECLLGYRHGGMEFKDIEAFDKWISEDDNMNRILPFQRCLVAMRVRRDKKERECDGRFMSVMINIELAELDKATFLYIRNGEKLYRMNCDLEFGEMIFPDKAMFSPDEPRMVKMFAGRVDRMISAREYDSLLEEYNDRKRKSEQWEAENPRSEWEKSSKGSWYFANPYRSGHGFSEFNPSDWLPFDDSNVYYDECLKSISDKIKQYNRIAVIIQGLFDRSEVLHPHPPVKTWTPDGFDRAVELIYDGSAVLAYGDAPDFEEYRARCNASLKEGSVTVGQDIYWQKKEAEKESRRLDNSWRNRSEWRPEYFKPYGNPGPGYLARIARWQPNARKAVFEWERARLSRDSWNDKGAVRATLTVPDSELFNVSAYKKGDYKQFFQDPRTRAQYLKWAPMLLAAEEYCAGNIHLE